MCIYMYINLPKHIRAHRSKADGRSQGRMDRFERASCTLEGAVTNRFPRARLTRHEALPPPQRTTSDPCPGQPGGSASLSTARAARGQGTPCLQPATQSCQTDRHTFCALGPLHQIKLSHHLLTKAWMRFPWLSCLCCSRLPFRAAGAMALSGTFACGSEYTLENRRFDKAIELIT